MIDIYITSILSIIILFLITYITGLRNSRNTYKEEYKNYRDLFDKAMEKAMDQHFAIENLRLFVLRIDRLLSYLEKDMRKNKRKELTLGFRDLIMLDQTFNNHNIEREYRVDELYESDEKE